MDVELTAEQASKAQACLRAMADAIEEIGRSTDAGQRRSHWFVFEENQSKLHELLPLVGDPMADEGPYTSET